MTGGRRRSGVAVLGLLLVMGLGASPGTGASTKPRAIAVFPFDASSLPTDDRWLGEGIVQIVEVGLTQHPAFVIVERSRIRAAADTETWTDAAVLEAARSVKADAAVFGRVRRRDADLVIEPRLLELRPGGPETTALEPLAIPESEFLPRVAVLPTLYARTLHAALTETESARMDKASKPTPSMRAFELYARGQIALQRGGQEANETAVDLLSRAIEADPNFVIAQYTLGVVHQALGNRWKAAAQFRAATQLDPTQPEPLKALGDLFLAAPRRLFDQAVEAYTKAIELRPFYADAYVGLGDAKAAKGEVDGAIGAYQKALVYNPVNPRVYLSLGKIYYSEKGLYYEAVTAYKRAIDLDPRSMEARMGLGEVFEDKGLYKEAIDEYRRVIESDPKHTGALYNLALVYEKVDPREAIVQWDRYIALASQLPSEKDWVDVARQHLRKLKSQLKE
jgi:tetratricopeptide (TPR) repeat protein/TolB-like protein